MSNATDSLAIPIPRGEGRKCAAQHMGPWSIEPKWFKAAMDAIRAGTWTPKAYDDEEMDDDGEDGPGYTVKDGIAVICIDGQMTKRGSSFGGCSTVAVRQALRRAAADWQVRAIILHVCSPGGTVAGTADLADDVNGVRQGKFGPAKTVVAYVADMACSAAYWVASQCATIYANKTAMVGSIGTYCVLEDDSGLQDQVGIKYRVVSTGPYKGLGADGKVSDELVADVQREVNELNQPFLAAVSAGRGSKIPDIAAVSDGRAYVSEQAIQLGLVDEIASLDAAIEAVSKRSMSMTPTEQVKQIAAEHPEAVASFIEQGKKAGGAEAHAAEVKRMADIEAACPGRPALAITLFKAGKDAEDAKLAVAAIESETKAAADANAKAGEALAAKDKEIEKLKATIGTQGAIGAGAAIQAEAAKAAAEADKAEEDLTVEQKAAAKFDADPKLQAEFQIGGRDKVAAKRAYVKWAINHAAGRTPEPKPAK